MVYVSMQKQPSYKKGEAKNTQGTDLGVQYDHSLALRDTSQIATRELS